MAARAQYERDNDSWRKMQHLVMQLRKCCNHPYLFPGAEPDFDGQSTGARQRLLQLLRRRCINVSMWVLCAAHDLTRPLGSTLEAAYSASQASC